MDAHTEELLRTVQLYQQEPRALEDAPQSLVVYYGYCALSTALLYKKPVVPIFDGDGKIREYVQTHEILTLDALIAYCKSQTEPIDRLFALWAWIAWNIEYDGAAYKGDRPRIDKTVQAVFENKRGVCEHYSYFLLEVAKFLELEKDGIILLPYGNQAKGFSFKPSDEEKDLKGHASVYVEINGVKFLSEPTWGAGFLDDNYQYHCSFSLECFLMPIYESITSHFPSAQSKELLGLPISGEDFLKSRTVHRGFKSPRDIKLESHPLYFTDCDDGYMEHQFSCIGPVTSISLSIELRDDDIDSRGKELSPKSICTWKVIEDNIPCHPGRVRFKIWYQFPKAGCYLFTLWICGVSVTKFFLRVKRPCATYKPVGVAVTTPGLMSPVFPRCPVVEVVNGVGQISYRMAKRLAGFMMSIYKCLDGVFFEKGDKLDNKGLIASQEVIVPYDKNQVETQITINFPSDGPYHIELWLRDTDGNSYCPEVSYFFRVTGSKKNPFVYPIEMASKCRKPVPLSVPDGVTFIPSDSTVLCNSMHNCLEIHGVDANCDFSVSLEPVPRNNEPRIYPNKAFVRKGLQTYQWEFSHDGEWDLDVWKNGVWLFAQKYIVRPSLPNTSCSPVLSDLTTPRCHTPRGCKLAKTMPMKLPIITPVTPRRPQASLMKSYKKSIVKPVTKVSLLEKLPLGFRHDGLVTPILPRHNIVDVFDGVGRIYYRVTKEHASEMLSVFKCSDGKSFTKGEKIEMTEADRACQQSVIVPNDPEKLERQITINFRETGFYCAEVWAHVQSNSYVPNATYYFRVRRVRKEVFVHPIQLMLRNRKVCPMEIPPGIEITPNDSVMLYHGMDGKISISGVDDESSITVNVLPVSDPNEKRIYPRMSKVDNVRSWEWTFPHEGLWTCYCWKGDKTFFQQLCVVESAPLAVQVDKKQNESNGTSLSDNESREATVKPTETANALTNETKKERESAVNESKAEDAGIVTPNQSLLTLPGDKESSEAKKGGSELDIQVQTIFELPGHEESNECKNGEPEAGTKVQTSSELPADREPIESKKEDSEGDTKAQPTVELSSDEESSDSKKDEPKVGVKMQTIWELPGDDGSSDSKNDELKVGVTVQTIWELPGDVGSSESNEEDSEGDTKAQPTVELSSNEESSESKNDAPKVGVTVQTIWELPGDEGSNECIDEDSDTWSTEQSIKILLSDEGSHELTDEDSETWSTEQSDSPSRGSRRHARDKTDSAQQSKQSKCCILL